MQKSICLEGKKNEKFCMKTFYKNFINVLYFERKLNKIKNCFFALLRNSTHGLYFISVSAIEVEKNYFHQHCKKKQATNSRKPKKSLKKPKYFPYLIYKRNPQKWQISGHKLDFSRRNFLDGRSKRPSGFSNKRRGVPANL